MNKREQKNYTIKYAISDYLKLPERERSLTKIGKKYGIKRQTLSKYLILQGYEVVNYQNKARLNAHIFDVIDTEEKAYWLGFLYADGNLSVMGNRIEVRLSKKDLSHLNKLREFLQLSNPIRVGKCQDYEFCHLSVRNKHMWNQLYNKGCLPQKSLILTFPSRAIFLSEDLIYDFIRGYVDGNGCLHLTFKPNTVRTELSIVSTKLFLEAVRSFLKERGYIANKTSKNYKNKSFSLKYSDVPSRKIARKLYENATVYLDRKYSKYKYFCQLEEQSSRRKSTKIGKS